MVYIRARVSDHQKRKLSSYLYRMVNRIEMKVEEMEHQETIYQSRQVRAIIQRYFTCRTLFVAERKMNAVERCASGVLSSIPLSLSIPQL